MIYTPAQYPKKAFIMISSIVFMGIFGGLVISEYFMAIALIFWIQYTIVLGYLQYKHGSIHPYNSFTGALLNPSLRLSLFIILALLGLILLIFFNNSGFAILSLVLWWLFALNFYKYYTKR